VQLRSAAPTRKERMPEIDIILVPIMQDGDVFGMALLLLDDTVAEDFLERSRSAEEAEWTLVVHHVAIDIPSITRPAVLVFWV